jgi:propionyl-CoA synthetase
MKTTKSKSFRRKTNSGYDIKIFDENGYELDAHHEGYLVIKLPLPPGALLGIWKDYDRFEKSYLSQYKGYYFPETEP